MKKICTCMIIAIALMSMDACTAQEQMGKLIFGKENLMLEKATEVAKNSQALSKENDGEEYEQIFISDTQFVEIHYGNMELPVSVVDEQVDDPFYYDYYKKDIEKMILNEEMAKDVAFVLLKPYFSKFSGNIFFCVQYIPDYGYYFVDIGRYESVVGYRVELVLDEKDGRVVYLWDIDPSLG